MSMRLKPERWARSTRNRTPAGARDPESARSVRSHPSIGATILTLTAGIKRYPSNRNGQAEIGRDGEIRTRDPLHPMQVRYQAAPRPDFGEGRMLNSRAGSCNLGRRAARLPSRLNVLDTAACNSARLIGLDQNWI
jgi:hypothetical protein